MSHKPWIPVSPDSIPPPGWVMVISRQTGDRFWADPASLKMGEKRITLTAGQLERIQGIQRTFEPYLGDSSDVWVENISRDGDPEKEIRIWERLARLLDDELMVRPLANRSQKELIVRILISASMMPDGMLSTDSILSVIPAAKSLPDLVRLINRIVNSEEVP